MKLTAIAIRGFLGVPAMSLQVDAPYLAIVGPNDSGKTSTVEAIRFALTGLPPRGVKHKKDYGALVSDACPQKASVRAELIGEHGAFSMARDVATGKLGGPELDIPSLPYVIDAHGFASLSTTERRQFLFGLFGVSSKPAEVVATLIKEGVSKRVADASAPLLKAGFQAAAAFATEQAAEARGRWKQITGETYGDQKGATWAPPVTADLPTPEAVAEVTESLRKSEAEINGLNQAIGAASRRLDPAVRATLEAQYEELGKYVDSQTRGNERLAELLQLIAATEALTKNNSGTTLTCPHCERPVIVDGAKLRAPVEEADVSTQVAATARLKYLRAELADTNKKLAELALSIGASHAAKAKLELAAADDGADPDALHQKLSALQSRTQSLREMAAQHRSQTERASLDATRGDQAKAAHEDVQAWKLAASLLSPDGIPARVLAAAIAPINAELERIAVGTHWAAARIHDDMEISVGGRAYALCSESRQWRADTMIAAAIATISGLRLLVLDRMDVLDSPARSQLWSWLLSDRERFDTVVVAGTLKEMPTALQKAGVCVHWTGVPVAQPAAVAA